MIVDCHIHLYGEREQVRENIDELLGYADRLAIDKLIICLGPQLCRQPDARRIELDTEYVLRAMEHAPRRIAGLVYGSPNHVPKTLELMERHIANGPMRGVKLWVCRRCCDLALDPIAEYAKELGVPILQHTFLKAGGSMPTESRPSDLVKLAQRHPRTQFLAAHSGGNWLHGIRTMACQSNIAVDLSGGEPEAGQTEYAVRWLGAERVLYGSDASGRSFASQLAKVVAADISDNNRSLILSNNAVRIFGLK